MNTDNMATSGETIDYGPCAFMDAYDPATVFSSIDHGGRYAYGNQPPIAQWNLARLAEALLPLFDDDKDKAVIAAATTPQSFPSGSTATGPPACARSRAHRARRRADRRSTRPLHPHQHALDYTDVPALHGVKAAPVRRCLRS